MARRGPKIKTAANSGGGPAAVPFPRESPEYLSELARAEHARLEDSLRQRGNLGANQSRLIELAAMAYDMARRAYATIEADGPTVESDRGNTSEHPSLQTLNSAMLRYKAIVNELGLTPASAKVRPGQDSNDRLAQWRAGLAAKGG